ncbi:MAG: hypothetical protein SAJ37_19000 [Oscillatoria sp. PMC 1068.18]|nr:hypothetical protein [Oscillatoria sp. PMC 1076.18]MEC4990827.1 hypothetical protein [Oscillatoria sp. PMC 1068.18]
MHELPDYLAIYQLSTAELRQLVASRKIKQPQPTRETNQKLCKEMQTCA